MPVKEITGRGEKMFNKIDSWLYRKASQKNISLNPSVARWGILQIIIGICLFAFAISVSFTALSLSLWSISMVIAIVALVLAVLALSGGVFVILYWFHLGNRWANEGSQDATATKDDIDKILAEIRGLRQDIKNGKTKSE